MHHRWTKVQRQRKRQRMLQRYDVALQRGSLALQLGRMALQRDLLALQLGRMAPLTHPLRHSHVRQRLLPIHYGPE